MKFEGVIADEYDRMGKDHKSLYDIFCCVCVNSRCEMVNCTKITIITFLD
ncbi:hypothetical protein Hanom_Chr12g01137761 [Helianthus anomalus]